MRFFALFAAIALLGAGCDPASALMPWAEKERTARETFSASSTPEAPPVSEPEMVSTLPPVADWPIWHGTWFDVQYPQGFTARAGAVGCIKGAGCDSAFFTSPDGKVEFYVFSPLWSGDPSPDLAIEPSTERLVEKKEQVNGQITTRWSTIAAKDGSYTRSIADIMDANYGSTLRHTFGIKYKDAASYAGWRDVYLAFKDSLVQYAD